MNKKTVFLGGLGALGALGTLGVGFILSFRKIIGKLAMMLLKIYIYKMVKKIVPIKFPELKLI